MWHRLTIVCALVAMAAGPAQLQVAADRSEAEASLAILDTLAAGRTPSDADWQRLYATRGYQRLKLREAGMGRSFTDADFQSFLRSPEAQAKGANWHAALASWRVDMADEAAARALAYLPPGTVLRATIFPMIKPRPNQFVDGLGSDPAIYLYLDATVSPAKSRNTMAHELHHIGMGAACIDPSAADPRVATLLHWTSAFGEGLAMLAAAGGPAVHPHADSPAAERAEWDRNIAQFTPQLREQNDFFRAVLAGSAGDQATVEAKMRGYFGVQGPWYTVGWRMAQVIEQQLGRPRLIAAFCHGDTLLATYNEAAARHNAAGGAPLPLWDATVAARLAARR